MKVLEVDKITKAFGSQKAVDQISFSSDEGVIFGLIGPNGAGKSTTIRMIMNIIIPDSGKISVLGKSNPREICDMIGYLPEERGMYRKMKVGELLIFLAALKKMSKHDAKKETDYWLDRLDIGSWKSKKIEELSKGMQQKVQFISTILNRPKLLILDEPFGGLDPINQNLIKDLILEMKQRGTTILFSTHVMESAEKLCEEIFLINKGQQVLYGKLAQIKRDWGRQHIHIEYEGDNRFLKSDQIVKYDNYGNAAEIQLAKSADPQDLLKQAVQSAVIRKFEINEPSLHQIFIETVGEEKPEGETV